MIPSSAPSVNESYLNSYTVGMNFGNVLNQKEIPTILNIGLWNRGNEAIVPYVGLSFNNLQAGLTYDVPNGNYFICLIPFFKLNCTMQISFSKYHGTGNDFIIIDNRDGSINLSITQIKHLCNRRFGIGADGLMLLNSIADFDFEMKYFNADGGEGSMCGNGGRCITQFAHDIGIIKEQYHFTATDGPHNSFFGMNNWIHLKMINVTSITKTHNDFVLNTGSPHYITEVTNINKLNVIKDGQAIRYSNDFKENGINVNFVQQEVDRIIVRTYERGVEDETYSCGTGVTAASLLFAKNEHGFNRIEIETKGGQLAVEFDKKGIQEFNNIWLCGPAVFVYKGLVEIS